MTPIKFAVVAFAGAAMPAAAAQITLAPANVYASTGDYDPRFLADNILDQQTGPINETAQDGSYWLSPNGTAAPATVSIDLGAQYRLSSFDLFNTHNSGFNDRGTGDFAIVGSNSASFGSYTTLASGTLFREFHFVPLTAQSFASVSNGAFRYIRFEAYSMPGGQTGGNFGLNELRAFGDLAVNAGVPEPSAWALMILGFGAVGGAARRARRKVALKGAAA